MTTPTTNEKNVTTSRHLRPLHMNALLNGMENVRIALQTKPVAIVVSGIMSIFTFSSYYCKLNWKSMSPSHLRFSEYIVFATSRLPIIFNVVSL